MRGSLFLLACLTLPTCCLPAWAGSLFNRQPKPDPAVRVPELLATVKNDPDEHKRASAAQELRQYDAAPFPNVVPTLLDVLLNDPKPSVRSEAAETLGKVRPISQQVGRALEHALGQDPSMRVRLQARYSLLTYHWGGYQSTKKGEPTAVGGDETPPPASLGKPVPVASPRLVPVPATSEPVPPAVSTQGQSPSGLSRLIWWKKVKTPGEAPPSKSSAKTEEGPELIPPR